MWSRVTLPSWHTLLPFYYHPTEQLEIHPNAEDAPESIFDRRAIRTLASGDVTLVYGRHDTWKPVERLQELVFCGQPMDQWLNERGVTPADRKR